MGEHLIRCHIFQRRPLGFLFLAGGLLFGQPLLLLELLFHGLFGAIDGALVDARQLQDQGFGHVVVEQEAHLVLIGLVRDLLEEAQDALPLGAALFHGGVHLFELLRGDLHPAGDHLGGHLFVDQQLDAVIPGQAAGLLDEQIEPALLDEADHHRPAFGQFELGPGGAHAVDQLVGGAKGIQHVLQAQGADGFVEILHQGPTGLTHVFRGPPQLHQVAAVLGNVVAFAVQIAGHPLNRGFQPGPRDLLGIERQEFFLDQQPEGLLIRSFFCRH